MIESAIWCRMRSGDWALRIPGQRWAVAFVWKTREMGYAHALPGCGGTTQYLPDLGAAKRRALERWEGRRAWLESDQCPARNGFGRCSMVKGHRPPCDHPRSPVDFAAAKSHPVITRARDSL